MSRPHERTSAAAPALAATDTDMGCLPTDIGLNETDSAALTGKSSSPAARPDWCCWAPSCCGAASWGGCCCRACCDEAPPASHSPPAAACCFPGEDPAASPFALSLLSSRPELRCRPGLPTEADADADGDAPSAPPSLAAACLPLPREALPDRRRGGGPTGHSCQSGCGASCGGLTLSKRGFTRRSKSSRQSSRSSATSRSSSRIGPEEMVCGLSKGRTHGTRDGALG